DEPFPSPLIGTWEPVLSDSANFFIRMSLNVACDEGPGFSTHYAVNFLQDGQAAEFQNIDGNDQHYQAQKVPGQRCNPDFSICETPTYP
ncbi:MAG: hypothetical protein JRJ19_10010, partial [Deltaproteobacteria bacterium]|nr:hypothetical protein [Deltaproteobacteria bacterium]